MSELSNASENNGPGRWLLVAPGFHRRGGMERANWELANHLSLKGAEVHLVGFEIDAEIGKQNGVISHPVPKPLGSYFLGERSLDRMGRKVARDLRRSDPEVRVLVNGGNCMAGEINWVHYVHHAYRPTSAGPQWSRWKERIFGLVARKRERRALQTASLIFANSDRTRSDLIERLDLPREIIHRVYLGIDPSFRPPTAQVREDARLWLDQPVDRPLVTFVGALGFDRRKGFDTLFDAWSGLCSDPAWDADLVVVGSGRDSLHWHNEIDRRGLENRVRLLGYSPEIPRILAASDLLVSPVRYESFGLNVQEALRMGVPAIVSAQAGVAELFPSNLRHLLLGDPEDARELGSLLRDWRGRIEETRARVQPLAEKIGAMSWPRMAEEIIEIATRSDTRHPEAMLVSDGRSGSVTGNPTL